MLRPGENLKVAPISEKATGADTLTHRSDYVLKNKKLPIPKKQNETIISPDDASKLQPRKSFSEKKPGNTFSTNHTDQIKNTNEIKHQNESNHVDGESVTGRNTD